jgi:hypothetical protein
MNFNEFGKISLIGILIVSLVFGIWFYSGFPRIWQKPPIPPKIQEAKAAAGDVILMWDGSSADIPAGWTCLSCAAGDPFYGVFPRASSTYATATSGADTVTHTLTFSTSTGPSNTSTSGEGAGTLAPSNTHTHPWGTPTLGSSDIRPPFKNLLFIKANNPTSLPAGIIGMFDIAATSSLPAGWTSYDALNASSTNIYLRGGENATSTGGATTHTHTTTATLTSSAASGTINDSGNTSAAGPTLTHTHNIAASSALTADNNNPPFATIVFGQLSSASDIPDGLIAFFDNASLPTNWSQISTSTVSGASFLGRLLVGSSTAGTIGGVSTHNHGGSVTWTSTGPSAANLKVKSGTTVNLSDATHTHNVTYTVSSASSFPVYRDVILGKFTKPTLNQSAFRWRNDDGSESTATWKAAENTAITNVSTSEIIRIRMEVEETNGGATTVNARLEFSSDATSCTNGTWTALDTSTTAWRIIDSANITNGDPTTNQLTTSAKTFTAGRIFDTQNEDTTGVSLHNTHTEWEWAIRGDGASGSTTYRFRITDSGTALNTYTNCAQLTTAAAAVVSVSVSDGNVAYGIMPANTSKSTLPGELNDMQTATNDGNVTENFNIKGQNATGGGCTWTLASTNGTDQYVHQFCNDTDYDCSNPPTNYTALTTSYQPLDTGIPVGGTVQIQLRLTTPTSSSCYGQQSVDVTIQAVQQ